MGFKSTDFSVINVAAINKIDINTLILRIKNNSLNKYNVNTQDADGNTMLHHICKSHLTEENVEKLEILIHFLDADRDIKNKFNETPLHAVCSNSSEFAGKLVTVLTSGKNINQFYELSIMGEKVKFTPLFLAVERKNISVITNLLKQPGIDIKNESDETAARILENISDIGIFTNNDGSFNVRRAEMIISKYKNNNKPIIGELKILELFTEKYKELQNQKGSRGTVLEKLSSQEAQLGK